MEQDSMECFATLSTYKSKITVTKATSALSQNYHFRQIFCHRGYFPGLLKKREDSYLMA